MNIGTTFSFTEKPDLGIYNEELSGVTVGKVYEVSRICVTGSALFIDDEGQENYAAGLDGMLKDYVQTHNLNKSEPYVYGWVILNKETGERPYTKSRIFETKNAAGAGFYQWTKRLGNWTGSYAHLQGKKLSDQDEFEVKPLIIWDEQ